MLSAPGGIEAPASKEAELDDLIATLVGRSKTRSAFGKLTQRHRRHGP